MIKVDQKFQDKLTMKAGTSAIVEIPFTGSPMPQVTWTYNDRDLPDYKRTREETIHGMTALTLSRVERRDSGAYKVLFENKHGSVTMAVMVTVLGKLKLESLLYQGWIQDRKRGADFVCCLFIFSGEM